MSTQFKSMEECDPAREEEECAMCGGTGAGLASESGRCASRATVAATSLHIDPGIASARNCTDRASATHSVAELVRFDRLMTVAAKEISPPDSSRRTLVQWLSKQIGK